MALMYQENPLNSANISYDPDYFGSLAEAEQRHFWFRARARAISILAGHAARLLPDAGWALEAGCGVGGLLPVLRNNFPRYGIVGLDGFPKALRLACGKGASKLVQGRVDALPFARRFNLACLFDVLEHCEDDAAVLTQVSSVLKHDGVLLISVPAHMTLWSYWDEAAGHCRRYSKSNLRNCLTECGFTIEYMTFAFGLLYPLMKLRGKNRHDSAVNTRERVQSELHTPAFQNFVLRNLLRLEEPFYRARLPLPLGTSLLAVAVKKTK